MDENNALHAVDLALTQRGFKRDWGGGAQPLYVGPVESHGLEVRVSIEIPDLEFVDQPIIRILSQGKASGKHMPHLVGPNGAICYIAANSTVLDRYDPGGAVLRCLLQAEKVIGDGLRGRLDDDFVDEFTNYWGGSAALIDLPANFEGAGEIYLVAFRKETGAEIGVLCAKGNLASSFRAAHVSNRGLRADPVCSPCLVVKAGRDLGTDWEGGLPRNLEGLSKFLGSIGKHSALDAALREGSGLS